jgi:catechol 2,3-dioxygenase-like lactoylglutathione lyase family enzyme
MAEVFDQQTGRSRAVLCDAQISAYVPVADLARGREFFEGVLQQPRQVGDAGVLYECANGSTFFMYLSDGAGTSRASCAFWSVDDIAREVAEMRARGVTFERYDLPGMRMDGDIAAGSGTKAAWFKDPDGNILALVQQLT